VSEHVHQHVPEELQEPGYAGTGRERIFEVLAIVLLSAAAIGTAWSGYQAARWSGREAHNFALAEGSHAKSTRAVVSAGEARVQDLADFERWFDLETTGDQTLANLHAAHFQGALRAAFDAWLDAGHAATMTYLARGRADRLEPARLLPGARSVIAVALSYKPRVDDPSWRGVAAYARGRLASYKAPKVVYLVDDLPRTRNGKVLHRALTPANARARSGGIEGQ